MSNGIDLITLALARKGGGGGTSDYTRLSNLPKINGVEVKGNLTAEDFDIQPKYITTTITLASADWSSNTQTVNVSGITSTALVQVSPVASDVEAYAKAKIICTAQGNGTLTFTCGSVPTSNLGVIVINWG